MNRKGICEDVIYVIYTIDYDQPWIADMAKLNLREDLHSNITDISERT